MFSGSIPHSQYNYKNPLVLKEVELSDISITMYSTGQTCHRCRAVARHLNKLGLEYTEIDLMQDRDKAVELRSQGHNEAPVLLVTRDGVEEWSEGYHPDYLDSLA